MLEESADELLSGDRSGFPFSGIGVFAEELDVALIDVEYAFVGDGDAVNIRSEVFERLFSGSYCFAIDDPVFLPDTGVDVIDEADFYHFEAKLFLENDG